MGAALVPAINTLGIGAPYIGPWFQPDINLGAPDTSPLTNGDFSVTVNVAAGTFWLPPVTGLLSFHVTTTPRPPALEMLLKPDGTPAFTDNRLVALYTIQPEVEQRLDALMQKVAPADGSAAGVNPTRARVRHLAMELPDTTVNRLKLIQTDPPTQGMSDADVAAYFGMALDPSNVANVVNTQYPSYDMRTPGKLPVIGAFDPMYLFDVQTQVIMYSFDHRGRPIDPGAVAAWWLALANAQNDMWAPGLDAGDKRTVAVAQAHSIHVVNAHDGQVDSVLAARLNIGNTVANEQLPVFSKQGAGALTIAFTSAPAGANTPDDAPVPRVAMFPYGRYQSTLNLWANPTLQRDFVRVGVVEIEEHLVGQKRTQPTDPNASADAKKRATDQQRWTTRVNVAQSVPPALMSNAEAATAAALAVISGNNTQIVTSVLDADWGVLPGNFNQLPGAAPNFPAALPAMTVKTLLGGDGNPGATPKLGQRVLIQFTTLPAGFWLRAWPVGFNLETGERIALTGGAGLVDVAGNVSLVVELPDTAGAGQLGIRFALTAPGGATRDYTEQRFVKPNGAGGGNAGIPWAANANNIILCEEGRVVAKNVAGGPAILPGTTVVEQQGNNFALLDRTTIPANAFGGVHASNSIAAGDIVELTRPAFKHTPDGAVTAGVGNPPLWNGANFFRTDRQGLDPLTNDSQPFASQERLESMCASQTNSTACVWTAPSLSRYHEIGAHNTGHPGAPAAIEIHGTGVALNGPAAMLVAEHTRDRIFKAGTDLVNAAINAPATPAAAAGATIWAAALKTVAASIEGQKGFGDKVISDDNDGTTVPYTFEPVAAGDPARAYESAAPQNTDIKKWFDDNMVTTYMGVTITGTPLPASNVGQANAWTAAQINSAKRAMDRRCLEAAWGLREAIPSISAAFKRAEDFIYIETPAMDEKGIGPDALKPMIDLVARMLSSSRLRLIMCIPYRLMPGWPGNLELIRNFNLKNMLTALSSIGGNRVAIFSPGAGQGRDVRLTSTTIIVDDAYAFTGTTHLWRRGLSYDSSLSVAIFDEALNSGRPADIVAFRRALLANQLSLPQGRIPDDPAALVEIIRQYNKQQSSRVGQHALKLPALPPDDPNAAWKNDDGWNPDGSYKKGQSIIDLLYEFLATNAQELNA